MEANIKVEDDWFMFNEDELVKEYNYLEKHVSLKEENEIINALEENQPIESHATKDVRNSAIIEHSEEIAPEPPINPNQDNNTASKTEGKVNTQMLEVLKEESEQIRNDNFTEKSQIRSRKIKYNQEQTASANEGDLESSVGEDDNDEMDNDEDGFEPTVDDLSLESDSDDYVDYIVKPRVKKNKSRKIPKKDHPKKEKDYLKDVINHLCTFCSFESDDRTTIVKHGRSEHLAEIGQNTYEIKMTMNERNEKQFDLNTYQNAKDIITGSLEKKESEYFFCKVCDFKTLLKNDLKRHLKLKHPSTNKLKMKWIYVCMYCIFKSRDRVGVVHHMAEIHKKSNVVYKCEYCSYECSIKRRLTYHLQFKHATKTHFCDYCSFKTTTKSSLKVHTNAIHTKEKIYKCTQCPYVTFRLSAWRDHVEGVHTKSKVYNCTHCTFFTFRLHALKRHINSKHTKEQIYSCKLCSFKTSVCYRLNSHLNQHTNIKPFLCSFCGAQFTRSSKFKTHLNIKHTKEKLYHCSHCDYKSLDPGRIYNHVNLVHIKKNIHQCLFCEYTTASRSSLTRHINRRHTEKSTKFDCLHCDFQVNDKLHLIGHLDYEHKSTN